jgi:oxygen-independent coproporphyrinogen III oxidase
VSTTRAITWARIGVNRVSVGVQSVHSPTLQWMHRLHEPAAGAAAVETVLDAGIGSVSADVIFGLPDSLADAPVETCEAIVSAGASHVSAYGLTVEPNTPIAKWKMRGRTVEAPVQRYRDEFLSIHAFLTDEGFEHYEVSNYGRHGHHSRHNRMYWSSVPYVGLGPSAHSFDGTRRQWNVREWAGYAARLANGDDPTEGTEVLTDAQRLLEGVYLGLRTWDGVAADSRGIDQTAVQEAMTAGWLEPTRGRVRATPEGWLRLDELVVGLTTSRDGG